MFPKLYPLPTLGVQVKRCLAALCRPSRPLASLRQQRMARWVCRSATPFASVASIGVSAAAHTRLVLLTVVDTSVDPTAYVTLAITVVRTRVLLTHGRVAAKHAAASRCNG